MADPKSVATSAPIRLVLRLYVAGDAPNSALARANLRRLLDGLDRDQYALEVIDCLDDPMRAIEDGVLVTPTLVRVEPEPRRTIVGSLSAADRVVSALDFPAERTPLDQRGPR
jgi:circadian clock protein KaiB